MAPTRRTDQTVCVILAGGRGKRMASADRHKVCFPIAGTPAIVRAISTYKEAGLTRFLVVVGQMAEEVMSTVSAAHPETTFVYQAEPLGTGHAAAVAARALEQQGHRGDVMVVMGDKVTRPDVVTRLLTHFRESGADVVISTLPIGPKTTAGRVVRDDDGAILGVVELPDIRRARQTGVKIRLAGRRFSADEIEARSDTANVSMYAFRFAALRRVLKRLRPDNVLRELYLPDTVEHLAKSGAADALALADPTDLMGFNTPAELLDVEAAVRRGETRARVSVAARRVLDPRSLRPAREWCDLLGATAPELRRELEKLYGTDSDLVEERRGALLMVARAAAERLGPERPVILCRAPGRVNLMGRHVDHRGGYVNVMAISREVVVAAAGRQDDLVTLQNVEGERFPARQFRIFDLLGETSWADWMDFLVSRTVQHVLLAAPGDWSHYVRAPLLRLQHECPDVRLQGMDCVVGGNIPMGAGLSSSSALVVAFAEAAVALNGLDVEMQDFVDLCGEGEWFVGSRGGSADHAAIRTSKVRYVSRLGFFPFRLEGEVPFPDDLQVVITHSGSKAVKSAGARDVFNQRVACYELAQLFLRRMWPPAAGMEHLRDLVPARLKVDVSDIYNALRMLPNRPSRRQIRSLLPREDHDDLDRIFATHANQGGYDMRGVAMFGIAECVRSQSFAQLLEQRDLSGIRRLMAASHDGDRRWRFRRDGSVSRCLVRTDDAALARLAATHAELSAQPGRYACSTRAIDQLVDIADSTDGVVGAQLAGAGLGGCMMILVRRSARPALMERLRQEFYEPNDLAFAANVCQPVAGAGILRL